MLSVTAPAESPWCSIGGGVTAAAGFQAAGITAGLKASNRADLALLLAPEGALCAGTFTTSVVRAACVDLCAERLSSRDGRTASRVDQLGPGQRLHWRPWLVG
jgi:glutamate N-acetyltransferase/amino-acid N-acetyltransferase